MEGRVCDERLERLAALRVKTVTSQSGHHGPPEIVYLLDLFPELSETFVINEIKALRRAGKSVRIHARWHARRPNPEALGEVASYVEDQRLFGSLLRLAELVVLHPRRCLRDLRARRRWGEQEKVLPLLRLAPLARRLQRIGEVHLHAHFAAGSALDALRLAHLSGRRYSVTAHAYDIFREPANLREKLERAALVVTGCEYNVNYLRGVVGRDHRERIHKVVMGVDSERFRPHTPLLSDQSVLSVGRLVEKKGFSYLIAATALLRQRGHAPSRVTIVGDGPLRGQLIEQACELGVSDIIEFIGARGPADVKELLELSAVFALPCVVAPDGDRDSMPVVVKEALAMEVPVVATDEVGLPEVVKDEWGRLVPPHDACALADAIQEVLALAPATRRKMGRAGRAFVLQHADVQSETETFLRLLRHTNCLPATKQTPPAGSEGHARHDGSLRTERFFPLD